METRQGTCKFCGQSRVVQVVPGATQETADIIATSECACEGAREQRRVEKLVQKTTATVDRMFEAYGSDVQSLMIGVVPYLADGAISKASFTIDEETTGIMAAKGNSIRVERKRLLVETAE